MGLYRVCYKMTAYSTGPTSFETESHTTVHVLTVVYVGIYEQVGSILNVLTPKCRQAQASSTVQLLVSQHQCGIAAENIGTYENVNLCAGAVYRNERCRGLPFMYSKHQPGLGCTCCSANHNEVHHVNWNFMYTDWDVYRVDTTAIDRECAQGPPNGVDKC